VVSEERVNIRIDLYLQLSLHLPGPPVAVVMSCLNSRYITRGISRSGSLSNTDVRT
jgi:hypothetical protein